MRYWDELREILYKLRRSWCMLKVYWHTNDCDWSSIGIVLQYQISRVRKHITEHNIIVGSEECGKQMRMAELLLERLLDEPYADHADKRFPERGKYWADMITHLEKRDMELLTKELRRHLRNWWD